VRQSLDRFVRIVAQLAVLAIAIVIPCGAKW